MAVRSHHPFRSLHLAVLLLAMLFGGAVLAADSDGDGVDDAVDQFPSDGCASVDTDRDGKPDSFRYSTDCFYFYEDFKGNHVGPAFSPSNFTGVLCGGVPFGSCYPHPYINYVTTTVYINSPTTLSLRATFSMYSEPGACGLKIDNGSTVYMNGNYSQSLSAGQHTIIWSNQVYSASRTISCTLEDIHIPKSASTLIEDTDDDNDGVADKSDKFPLNRAASVDADNDGAPSSWNASCNVTCQVNSGLVLDNCPSNSNANQLNTDGDTKGDVCDTDDDNDGWTDTKEASCGTNSLSNTSVPTDTDGDLSCNAVDADDDNDGVADTADLYPLNAAKWQAQVNHDMDLDRDSDVLIRSASLGTWTHYSVQNNAIVGNGVINAPTASDSVYVAQLDANGDGDADILTRSASTGAWSLSVVENGAVTSTTPIYLYANLDQQFIGSGDFNNDGIDDVMLRSASAGYYTVFLLANHAVNSTVFYNAWTSSQSVPQGIGDFDGDGTDDLLVRRTSDNLYFIFKTTNGATANNYCACNIWANTDWSFQFAGDTNKDGIDDIVVRGTGASADGKWWAFRMNNFSSVLTTNLNLFLNKTAVSVGAVGDYNGDGTIDVLTRVNNSTTYVSPIVNGTVTGNYWLYNFTTDQVIGR